MKHAIQISVNNVTFQATASIAHGNSGRVLESVTAEALPVELADVLANCVLSENDILYLTMKYALITGRHTYSFACGPVDVQCRILDPQLWDADLNGKTFMVKVTDCHGNRHLFDVGAHHSIEAFGQVSDALQVPIRNSVSQPVPFL